MKSTPDYDVIVIGAGFTGLYAVYKLRESGLSVRGIEAGTGVGGTWYWNRYPGARTDSQSYVYQYFFSEDLLDKWEWSERFPAQNETESYLNYVADKFKLKEDFQFETRVNKSIYNEKHSFWELEVESGEKLSARFVVMGSGGLTVPKNPEIRGINDFKGQVVHTSRWPKENIDIAGKKVGIIGTGATGIQVIQTIGDKVEELTVFQRTANYTIPMRNPKYDSRKREELRSRYPEIKDIKQITFGGFDFDFQEQSFHDLSRAERVEIMQKYWEDGSLSFWIGQFPEVFFEEAVNEEFSDFVKDKIRERINDPKTAEKLIPKNHGFGTRRVPLENNYYEIYNRPNTNLVNLGEEPIITVTESGIETEARAYNFDILIFATGFDAGTGALTAMDVFGRGGKLLREEWKAKGISTFMGLQVHGYPNMFLGTMAPMSPGAAFCNVPTCAEHHVNWISACINHVIENNAEGIEPTLEAEKKWVNHHDELARTTLMSRVDSWYTGANVPGKERRVLPYCGGLKAYKEHCDNVKDNGFKECRLF